MGERTNPSRLRLGLEFVELKKRSWVHFWNSNFDKFVAEAKRSMQSQQDLGYEKTGVRYGWGLAVASLCSK